MKPIYFGMRPLDRLRHIPVHLRPHHEFCFYLHDRMAALLTEYEAAGAHQWVSDSVAEAAMKHGFEGELDVLDILKKAGLAETGKHVLLGHLVLGLTSDLLHFLYEGLCCLEKRKFAVAFSLLRKPFKENMLFLAWLLGDPEDFLTRLEKNTYSTLNGLQSPRRQELFKLAADKLAIKEAFDGELIEQMVFSKEQADGLEPLWQKATHLITSQGANLKTEDLNINFIFNDAMSDHLYETIYKKLPYLMLFLVQLALRSFSEIAHANAITSSHLVLVSVGAYECLIGARRRPASKFIVTKLKTMLSCLHCSKPFKFDRFNSMSFFLTEQMTCAACGLANEVPLYWLLAKSKLRVMPQEPLSAYDKLMREMKDKGPAEPTSDDVDAEH